MKDRPLICREEGKNPNAPMDCKLRSEEEVVSLAHLSKYF